jgi:hypothetical protein
MFCVTVSYGIVRGKAKQYQYYQAAIYRAVPRKDGILTWRHLYHTGTARRSAKLAEQDAMEIALEKGYPYVPNVRHGLIVSDTRQLEPPEHQPAVPEDFIL